MLLILIMIFRTNVANSLDHEHDHEQEHDGSPGGEPTECLMLKFLLPDSGLLQNADLSHV